ncbi:uncharacterized protein [Procambarus clarkii]|uniref:uncharacterized protein n=1 Tax=Procambarus clarkii TaxID=6728 RepID=UPI003744801F
MTLDNIYQKKMKEKLPDTFGASFQKMICYAENSLKSSELYENLLKTLKEKKKIKRISANVPHGILSPEDDPAILHDIKVNCYGPDDTIYNNDPEVRKNVPRGVTLLEFKGQFDLVIFANKKFTGGIGDEDDKQPETNDLWKQYCLEDPTVCELLQPDNQHIVNLSHLDKHQLNVICFTPLYNEYQETSLLALPPHYTLNLFTALGFTSPAYSIIEAKDVVKHQNKVRSDLYKEGEVFYFLNENEETIGMIKVKTRWKWGQVFYSG